MAEQNQEQQVNVSAYAFDGLKKYGFADDEAKYKEWETDFIKKIYEMLGLADIPGEFLNWNKFVEAYTGVLMKSVQNDLTILNLTKRLAMFKLSGEIQATGEEAKAEEKKEFVPPYKSTPPPGEG